ncbi:MAG: iron donor protein CyaY [Polyangiaceae bacterium]|nr:iron donor protein CyaY [Polyangiaceae bacterium]
MMDERRYFELADAVFREIEDRFNDVDADDVDVERAGDVITLTFRDGRKCIINTQRPTRQIWLAANARAWHFDFDETTSRWVDDKGQGVELVTQVAEIVRESAGIAV